MNMQKISRHFTLAVKLAAALSVWMACGTSFAVQTWNYTDATGNLSTLCSPDANTSTCGTGLSVSGFSTAGGTGESPTVTTNFSTASVNDYGSSNGLGIVASSETTNTGPSSLTSSGWSLVGNYFNVGSNSPSRKDSTDPWCFFVSTCHCHPAAVHGLRSWHVVDAASGRRRPRSLACARLRISSADSLSR